MTGDRCFSFRTILNHTYSSPSTVAYFFQKDGKMPKWITYLINVCFMFGAIYGSSVTASVAWDFGDTGLGIMVWINYIFLLMSVGVAIKLLKDFEEQQRQGLDPVFDPDKFEGVKGFDFDMSLWRTIRDKYRSGERYS